MPAIFNFLVNMLQKLSTSKLIYTVCPPAKDLVLQTRIVTVVVGEGGRMCIVSYNVNKGKGCESLLI